MKAQQAESRTATRTALRRLGAGVPAVLLVLTLAADPAVAKPSKAKDDKGSTPVTAPTAGGSGDSAGSGQDQPSPGGSSGGDDVEKPSTGSDKGPQGSEAKDPKGPKAPTTAPRPRQSARSTAPSSTSAPTPSATTGSKTTTTTPSGSRLVRAQAAPAAVNNSGTAILPQPNPVLLPESAATARSAPVDSSSSSQLPSLLPAVIVGAGLVSVGVGGTLLARRRRAAA